MKKKTTTPADTLTIDEIAELYRKYDAETKAAAKNGDKYKKQLIEYARQNPALFADNTLTLSNGVCIDIRTTPNCTFDEDAITPDWIARMCDADCGDFVTVTLDKKITADDHHLAAPLAALLSEIGFSADTKQSFVIRA